jgi:hypothetical protein
MRRQLVLLSTFVVLLAGCRSTSHDDPHAWFIESYDGGIVTVRHEGHSYRASCDTSRSFNNAASITDPRNVIRFPTCGTTIGLVGHAIQPFGGKHRDGDGWIIVMWTVGDTLVLSSWRDEHSPWKQEDFRITSVVPIH